MRKSPKDWLAAQPGKLGPAWRSIIATRVASNALRKCVDDGMITAAADYLQHSGSDPSAAAAARPLMAAAYDLNANSEVTSQLKIMIAGQLDPSEVAEQSGLAADVIATWEKLFVDTRNRKMAAGWLVRHLVVPEQLAGNFEFASHLKLAIAGGPVITRKILSLVASAPNETQDTLQRLRLRLQLKAEHAFDRPAETPEQSFAWLKLTATFELAVKRLAFEETKFAARQDIEQKKFTLIEQDLAERAAARAERKAEREQAERQGYLDMLFVQKQDEADLRARIAASPLAQLRWTRADRVSSVTSAESRGVIPLASAAADNVQKYDELHVGEIPQTRHVPKDGATGSVPLKRSA